MHKLKRLTNEIRALGSGELAALRAWFHDFDNIDADRQIDAQVFDGAVPNPSVDARGPLVGASINAVFAQAIDRDPCMAMGMGTDIEVEMEMVASVREAYRQIAYREYAQFMAADNALASLTNGTAHR